MWPSGLMGLKVFAQKYGIVKIQNQSSGHLNMATVDAEELR